MIKLEKNFLLCRKYEKDIWGDTTVRHKMSNFARLKLKKLLFKLNSFAKGNKGLKDFQKRLLIKNVKLLTFSFEIVKRVKKK
jgi:hypothetical protein